MSPKDNLEFPKKEDPKPDQQTTRPFTIMTENDAYIAERMKGQPQSISDIDKEIVLEDKDGIHRLSLPDYFEPFSFDCTRGSTCPDHGWKKEKIHYGLDLVMDRYAQTKHGKYVFRWLSKHKRALDHSINVRGWYLVNRSYFSNAPQILFSVNGGIENGDSILGFMSIEKAMAIRNKPSKESLDHINSVSKKHEGNPNFYEAKLDPEGTGNDDYAPAGSSQIDFDGTIIRR